MSSLETCATSVIPHQRIVLVTDASQTHVSGVLTTVNETVSELRRRGHDVLLISPENIGTAVNFPLYPDVRWVLNPWKIWKVLRESRMNAIHIVTEGPLGLFAARFCVSMGIPFTSSYHTKIPEYINEQVRIIPVQMGYEYMRLTHNYSKTVLVNTESLRDDLLARKFHTNIHLWGRAVDTHLFSFTSSVPPDLQQLMHQYSHPRILLYVGRLTRQKNVEAFLDVPVPKDCIKVLIGSGPDGQHYRAYAKTKPDATRIVFLGPKPYKELPLYYSTANVFVFPSKTDTLGLVMLEAMSCGAPVAAFRVTGPVDVIQQGINGIMCEDERSYQHCIEQCLKLQNRQAVRESALRYSWERETDVFERNLQLIPSVQMQTMATSPLALLVQTQVQSIRTTVSHSPAQVHVKKALAQLRRPSQFLANKTASSRNALRSRAAAAASAVLGPVLRLKH